MARVREKKKEYTRQRILKAAWELFNDQGFAKTTVGQIAEHAEVGTGTVYNYFPSKEYVLAARFTEIVGQAIKKFSKLDRPPEPTQALAQLFDTLLLTLTADRNLMRETISVYFLPRNEAGPSRGNSLEAKLEDLDWQIIQIICTILEDAKANSQLDGNFDSHLASMTIYSVFMFNLMGYLTGIYQDLESTRSITSNMVSLIFNGLKGGIT